MRTAIIIPARYASTRLPAKPLLKSTGKYLIQHVFERACQARRARFVIVATDDPRIAAAVESFGGNYVVTHGKHDSGTSRIAEVAQDLDVDAIVNVQGDEPEVDPLAIDRLVDVLASAHDAAVATLAAPIESAEQWRDPNVVKVVCAAGRALYFSRAPIPWQRDGQPDFAARPARHLRHLGLYAYRRDFLLKLGAMPRDGLEQIEKLEQLQWLAAGFKIAVEQTSAVSCGVDTPQEYENFVRRTRRSGIVAHAELAKVA